MASLSTLFPVSQKHNISIGRYSNPIGESITVERDGRTVEMFNGLFAVKRAERSARRLAKRLDKAARS